MAGEPTSGLGAQVVNRQQQGEALSPMTGQRVFLALGTQKPVTSKYQVKLAICYSLGMNSHAVQ